jgi:dTDP-4-dehydrorhamnose reductase
MNRILVIGAGGQVGSALKDILKDRGIFLTRDQLDLTDISSIKTRLANYQFEIIINAAAYTKVDDAEDNSSLCYDINANSVLEIAQYCEGRDIPLVHYSTDYVFDGSKDGLYSEDDETGPLSIYGKSKLKGEENIKKTGGKYFIFRTSWVYDSDGHNFLNTMLKLGVERDVLRIVSDQYGSPTYAADLAKSSLIALENALSMGQFPSGIYHLTNSDFTSWYGFAKNIFELSKSGKIPNLIAIASAEFPTKAARPKNSKLSNDKIRKILGVEMRGWKDALVDCLSTRF